MSTAEPKVKDPFLASLADEYLRLKAEEEAKAELVSVAAAQRGGWPAYGRTVHPVTGYEAEGVPLYKCLKPGQNFGKVWCPRDENEYRAVLTDSPRYVLLRGGEGSAKSTAAVVKILERLRRGMEGIFASPDFEHFKGSAWPLFREWCPPEVVDKSDRHMLEETWEASRKFELHVRAQGGGVVALRCAGIEDPASVRGGNVHFACFDEASRHKDAKAFKFLAGRARLLGPQGEPPQVWLSTTPEMNWLYDYFGPLDEDEPDKFERFKRRSLQVVLATVHNIQNLDPEYVEERSSVLTEAETRVYMGGEWEDLTEGAPFLESMVWWDNCKENLPPVSPTDPMIVGMDAGISDDPFALVGWTRHPWREGVLCPRLMMLWPPTKGRQLDFELIQADIEALKGRYNILSMHYDPWQAHQMGTSIRSRKVFHTVEFKQGGEINVADKAFLDAIMERKVAWCPSDENSGLLYEHLKNADRKLDENRKIRICKRTHSKKIDLARAASMGRHRAGRLWKIPAPPPRSSAHSNYR